MVYMCLVCLVCWFVCMAVEYGWYMRYEISVDVCRERVLDVCVYELVYMSACMCVWCVCMLECDVCMFSCRCL